jgi:hypothetical protein
LSAGINDGSQTSANVVGNQKWSASLYNGYLNPELVDWNKHGTIARHYTIVPKTEGHLNWPFMHKSSDFCWQAIKKFTNLVSSHDGL